MNTGDIRKNGFPPSRPQSAIDTLNAQCFMIFIAITSGPRFCPGGIVVLPHSATEFDFTESDSGSGNFQDTHLVEDGHMSLRRMIMTGMIFS